MLHIRCPHGVIWTGSRSAIRQIGHSNALSNGPVNFTSYPGMSLFVQWISVQKPRLEQAIQCCFDFIPELQKSVIAKCKLLISNCDSLKFFQVFKCNTFFASPFRESFRNLTLEKGEEAHLVRFQISLDRYFFQRALMCLELALNVLSLRFRVSVED